MEREVEGRNKRLSGQSPDVLYIQGMKAGVSENMANSVMGSLNRSRLSTNTYCSSLAKFGLGNESL